MAIARPNPLAAGTLDRASHRRQDSNWLEEAKISATSRVTLVWRSRNLVTQDREPRAELIGLDRRLPGGARLRDADSLVLLGIDRQQAIFAVDVSDLDDPVRDLELGSHAEFQELRKVAAMVEPATGSMLAYARAMMSWQQRHRYCGCCGARTLSAQGGHLRVCSDEACGAEIFPRTDPAVIMLVLEEDRCLLGRQSRWAQGVYSTLAGFVEPGESLEDAVQREVREEAGLLVDHCRYSSSQPWPFPSSLMLGFFATRTGGELRVDRKELEDARWFSKQQILERQIRLPPRLSIARRLIDDWLRGEVEPEI